MYSNRRNVFKEISKKFNEDNKYINKETITLVNCDNT